jgi:N-succinyldiaminopimelate aminotransferase
MSTSTKHLISRAQGLGTTIFAEFSALANQHSAINLGQGFPDMNYSPSIIQEKLKQSIQDPIKNQYCRFQGILDLCKSVSIHQQEFYGLKYNAEKEITITNGATEAIYATITALCEVGDEVILFQPYYDSYKASVVIAGAVPKIVTLNSPSSTIHRSSQQQQQHPHHQTMNNNNNNFFSFDPIQLKASFTSKTRLILVNTPHNPTGKVWSQQELAFIGELCLAHPRVYAVMDEVYEHLIYDNYVHFPLASMNNQKYKSKCITISSSGKTFGLTGWKIGTICADEEITSAIRCVKQFMSFNTCSLVQHAIADAYTLPKTFFQNLSQDFQQRRDLLVEGLNKVGLTPVGNLSPPAGYFVVTDISKLGFTNDYEFCKMITTNKKIGVAGIPCSVFYDGSYQVKSVENTLVRFAFCKHVDTIKEGVKRLEGIKWLE